MTRPDRNLDILPHWIVGGLLVLSFGAVVRGHDVSIVVPNGYEELPGSSGSDRSCHSNGWRIQNVFNADQFSTLPESHRVLTGFQYRPDEVNVTEPFSETWNRLTLIAGTSSLGLDELEPVFAENLQQVDNPIVVYDGPIEFATQNQTTDTGVKEFDLEFKFQEPIVYNPNEGNLLIDWRIEPFCDIGWDRTEIHDVVGAIAAANADSAVANVFNPTSPPITKFVFMSQRGDFNANGVLDAGDIDQLSRQVSLPYDSMFDLNVDNMIDSLDRGIWVHELAETYAGDSNLDGEFNSGDLVAVFQAGEYEDHVELNSGWATGDWNGDAEFDTGDLVFAFEEGGFEKGPVQAVSAVPEPSGIVLMMIALTAFASTRRHHRELLLDE